MMKRSSRQFGQDLVAKVKNLVALAPVLGAISRPDYCEVGSGKRKEIL